VFSLAPPITPGGAWTETTLYNFPEGERLPAPPSRFTISGGVLYNTTRSGDCACGTVFSLTPPPTVTGQMWTETTLYNFTGGSDGGNPTGDLAISSDGTIYGTTQAGGASGAGTVFALKLVIPQPSVNPGGIVNAATYTAPVAPGSIASVFGNFSVPAPVGAAQLPLPDTLSELSLQFNATEPAPLMFASGGQVNFQVPWELAGQQQATLAATLYTQTSAAQTVNLANFAPAIFTTNAQGSGQGAILDTSYRLVDSTNPVAAGSFVLIYCTGLGAVSNQPATGAPALSDTLSWSATPMVTIGGLAANVQFSGLAPGYVGLYQVNAQVPTGSAAGSAVPVALSIGGVTSNTVTIAVQ
jgi:uncharacterized protein (TIGR03437 family)